MLHVSYFLFRNCLVGKGLQIKICDFGTDSDIYGLDYYRSDDQLLGLPVRWMAWESVVQVCTLLADKLNIFF